MTETMTETMTVTTTIATDESKPASVETVPLYPQVAFPEDAGLPGLPKLFDGEWVWQESRRHLTAWETAPEQIRVRQFSHNPGRTAIVSYIAEWDPEAYIPPEIFTFRLDSGRSVAFSRYPEDHALPGLEKAAHPDTALRLLNRHVFAIPRRSLRVDMVRYRPGSRAVLRHRTDKIRLYVRVMRPSALPNLLAAGDLMCHSGFAVPRVAGCWSEGGVVWLSEIPGNNVRQQMRRGHPPDPNVVLDGLESLWAAPFQFDDRAFDLAGAYRRAKRTFRHALQDYENASRILDSAIRLLDPFARSWRPTAIAHNDLYDDQMLVLPDGRVAIVDFEEAGPGDPMLDVGNFLAHLKWASCFGKKRKTDASGEYYHRFRAAALNRHRWSEQELDLREAICLFRITTNTIRRLGPDWKARAVTGLSLVNESLS